jgi:hypothetical protein
MAPKARKVKTTATSGHSTAGATTPASTWAQPPVLPPAPATVSPFLPPAVPVKRYGFLKRARVPSALEVSL